MLLFDDDAPHENAPFDWYFWTAQIGGALVAIISAVGSLLITAYFGLSLRKGALKCSQAAKIVRFSIVLVAVSDAVLSLCYFLTRAIHIVNVKIYKYPDSGPWYAATQILMLITFSSAIMACVSTVCLGVALLVAAIHVTNHSDVRHPLAYVATFCTAIFGVALTDLSLWIARFVYAGYSWTGWDTWSIYIEKGAIFLMCGIFLTTIFVCVLILLSRRRAPPPSGFIDNVFHKQSKRFVIRFSRYLVPYIICIGTVIALCVVFPMDMKPGSIGELIKNVIIWAYTIVFPLQGLLNSIVFVLNSERSIAGSFRGILHRYSYQHIDDHGDRKNETEQEDDEEEYDTT